MSGSVSLKSLLCSQHGTSELYELLDLYFLVEIIYRLSKIMFIFQRSGLKKDT